MPLFEHNTYADGGSAPLSALLGRFKLVSAVKLQNISGIEPLKLLASFAMCNHISAVSAARLGKGPVTDDTPHGIPEISMDDVEVGKPARADKLSVMLLLPPPKLQLPPRRLTAIADGGSVPLSALL